MVLADEKQRDVLYIMAVSLADNLQTLLKIAIRGSLGIIAAQRKNQPAEMLKIIVLQRDHIEVLLI